MRFVAVTICLHDFKTHKNIYIEEYQHDCELLRGAEYKKQVSAQLVETRVNLKFISCNTRPWQEVTYS